MSKLHSRHHVIPAVYCLLRDSKKVLLLRRFNTGYKNGWYTLPSGHIEENEPADAAACREAKEEVGVTIGPADLRLAFTLHSRSHDPETHERISLFFEVSKWQGEPLNAEPNKCDELLWADVGNLPHNTIDEVKTAISNVAASQPYADIGFEGKAK